MAASFHDCDMRLQSVRDAQNVLPMYRSLYAQIKMIQTMWQRYDGNKDKVFVSTIAAMYNADEIKELKDMVKNLTDLIKDWENDHKGALGI